MADLSSIAVFSGIGCLSRIAVFSGIGCLSRIAVLSGIACFSGTVFFSGSAWAQSNLGNAKARSGPSASSGTGGAASQGNAPEGGAVSQGNALAPGQQSFSALEVSVREQALRELGYEWEPHPEGMQIESVETYVLPVFDDRDPIPNFLNIFHHRSRDWIIEQETLFSPGQRYDDGRVKETERNLRELRQLSLANVVAAKGSEPGLTRLVVVVKDVWSLRLNSNFGFGQDGLEFLLLNPAEENLGGLHLNLGLLYLLDRARHSFGAQVIYPRLAGSRHWLASDFSVSLNRESGNFEGTSGTFIYAMPLYSRYSSWGYGASLAWRFEISRRFTGSEVRNYEFTAADGSIEEIPQTFDTKILASNYYITRSWGVLHKLDFTLGFEVSSYEYRPRDLSQYSAAAQAAFIQDVIPVSDTRLSPYAQLYSFKTDFLRTLDVEILGLQEDLRLGYESLLRVYLAGDSMGSSRSLVGTRAGISYTFPLGDGLVRTLLQNDLEVADQGRNQAKLRARARLVSPRLPVGRLHIDGIFSYLYADYLNAAPVTLGGNNRLRGYGFDQFQGKNLLAVNTEFRTRSIDILSAQVGLAFFYDVGGVSDTEPFSVQQGVGLGGRILFPQAERTVLRFDWGVPLRSEFAEFPGSFYVTFGQAFTLPGLNNPSSTTGVSIY